MENNQPQQIIQLNRSFVPQIVIATTCGVIIIVCLIITVIILAVSLFITGSKSLRGYNY